MVIGEPSGGTSGYGNPSPIVLSVCQSPEWWIDTGANVHVCADISLFSSYQPSVTGDLMMGNGAHARVLGVGTVILKFSSGKTVPSTCSMSPQSKGILLAGPCYVEMVIK